MGEHVLEAINWLAERLEKYQKFMQRVHRVIIEVIKAEKEERVRRRAIHKTINGYDSQVEARADGKIKGDEAFNTEEVKMVVAIPVGGPHQMAAHQVMYEEVSRFLANQKWKMPGEHVKAAGTTWLELFILFDIGGYRSDAGRMMKDPKAAKRAEARREKNIKEGRSRMNTHQASAEIKARLGEELERFKKICRFIGRNDLSKEQEQILKGETEQKHNRLKSLGVIGHHPGIKGVCMIMADEKAKVEEAIFRQKYGTTLKKIKAFNEHKIREDGDTLLVKKARVDIRSCPKWGRVTKSNVTTPSDKPQAMYSSRRIACTQCQHQNETALKQLRTAKGFRAIHCAKCGAQTLAKGMKCSCGITWHLCEIHRTDPCNHRSRKAPRAGKKVEKATADEVGKSCKRKTPDAIQRSSSLKKEKKPSKKKLHVHNEMQKGIEATRLKDAWQHILQKRAARGDGEGGEKRERKESQAEENPRAMTPRVMPETAKFRRISPPLRAHLKRGTSESDFSAVCRLIGRPRLA